jgi:hypothetical protein
MAVVVRADFHARRQPGEGEQPFPRCLQAVGGTFAADQNNPGSQSVRRLPAEGMPSRPQKKKAPPSQ